MSELPILFSTDMVRAILDDRKPVTRRVIIPQPEVFDRAGMPDYADLNPRYQKGDLLYVREAFTPYEEWENSQISYLYKADYSTEELLKVQLKWKPSIHMPKKAARLWLEVLDVRAERLQEITLADISAEGVEYDNQQGRGHLRDKFICLWDSLNAKRGYPWIFNPWVWRYEFKRAQK